MGDSRCPSSIAPLVDRTARALPGRDPLDGFREQRRYRYRSYPRPSLPWLLDRVGHEYVGHGFGSHLRACSGEQQSMGGRNEDSWLRTFLHEPLDGFEDGASCRNHVVDNETGPVTYVSHAWLYRG